jgi:phosphoadenosine phosphosulfate reductase
VSQPLGGERRVYSPGEVHEQAAALRGTAPEDIVRWALTTFPGKTALTVSFGGGGVVLASMISQIDKTVPVIFLDTGFHFPETLEFKTRFVEKYGLNLIEMHPLTDPGPLYQTDPDACCGIRKVEPLQRALTGFDAWISAVRGDQGSSRAGVEVVEYHESGGQPIVKVFPLAAWSRDDVWRYIREHDILYHPLLDQGFTSIGCWPCTRATRPGEPERAGRWSGMGKTECGLHTFTTKV